jgi:hypothetical protein
MVNLIILFNKLLWDLPSINIKLLLFPFWIYVGGRIIYNYVESLIKEIKYDCLTGLLSLEDYYE